jgi:N-glycosidase YbiA
MTPSILFYETDKAYGCFSNFSRHAIVVDGTTWPTTEHFFQAAKFTDPADVAAVREARTPFVAAQLGRERHRSFRPDWDTVRDSVMLGALRAKFTQHPALREILLSTHGATLVEHTANDRYWADGGDGSGRNMLGKLLEAVREELVAADGGEAPRWCVPPWVAHPDIEPSDMQWRMGGGEGVAAAASSFRQALGPAAGAEYDRYFPVPAAWARSW